MCAEKFVSKDDFAWKLASHLSEDFEPFVDEIWLSEVKACIGLRDIAKFRQLSVGHHSECGAYELKARLQLLNLFKKHTFSPDAISPEAVLQDSVKKFMDNQKRIDSHVIDWSTPEMEDIRSRTRGHIDTILGYFSKFFVLEKATFGKKSSVGIPQRNACEGARYEPPITGSSAHCEWFRRVYSLWNRPAFNYAESLAANRKVPLTLDVDTLTALLVNKTYKSKRMIVPNTTIGTLYSSGLGKVLEDALRAAGYDIRHLQKVHGELARLGSITGSIVTADQSLASDNITTVHISEFFSREWADALTFGRIGKLEIDGQVIETNTFATMGIGFTFPMQTLIFLSVLLAIRDHLGLESHTVVSVFGDDMIYDIEMHATVLRVFSNLGFVINEDKTFAEGNFRESCGFDYYRGFDVRPYHFGEDDIPSYKGVFPVRRVEAFLYKVVNGIRRRWADEEVSVTLSWLQEVLCNTTKSASFLIVPHDYPDTAGVKLTKAEFEHFPRGTRPRVDVHGTSRFRCLAFKPDERIEDRHAPYLWQNLRASPLQDARAQDAIARVKGYTRSFGAVLSPSPETFKRSTKKELDNRSTTTFRSKVTGRRLLSELTTIAALDRGRYVERPGVTSHWAPEKEHSHQVNALTGS